MNHTWSGKWSGKWSGDTGESGEGDERITRIIVWTLAGTAGLIGLASPFAEGGAAFLLQLTAIAFGFASGLAWMLRLAGDED